MLRRTKSMFKLFTLVSLLAMLLGACGQAAQPVATEAPAQPTATDAPAATEAPSADSPKPSGKLVGWAWGSDAFKDTGVMDEFKAEYPDIEAEFVDYKSNDVYQKLRLATSAGSGAPDIAQVESSNIGGFIEMNGLTDMTPWVK